MSALGLFRSLVSADLAIDLGSSSTHVYARGAGIVCSEPSVLALKNDETTGRRSLLAIGAEAKEMIGRTPLSVSTIRPVREGIVIDFDATILFLKTLLRRVQGGATLFRPRVIVCVPHGLTEVERRAARDSVAGAGARDVSLIEEPIAAAVGADLPVDEPRGTMVMDIGGGTTEIAVIAMGGVVYSRSLRVGGDKVDASIVALIKKRLGVLVGDRTAESIKIALGQVTPSALPRAMEVHGRDVVLGLPRVATVTEAMVREALGDIVAQMADMVRTALEKTPPELSADILERGLTLTGGGALLRGIDTYLQEVVGLPVRLVDDPVSSVVLGAGKVLDNLLEKRHLLVQ